MAIVVILWLGFVGAGFTVLETYANQPGPPVDAPRQWPRDVGLQRAAGELSLVVFIHPRCGCSNATMRELDRLLTETGATTPVQLVYFCPLDENEPWVDGATWRAGAAIPGATRHIDFGGTITAHFGALTSGTVLAYDADGALRFNGGLTTARAHEGRSAGRQLLARLIRGEPTSETSTPVYGCPLGVCPPGAAP